MSQKGFGLLFAILLAAIALIFSGFVYLTTIEDPSEIFARPLNQKEVYERKNQEYLKAAPSAKEISPVSMTGNSLSNPASEYCIKVGGTLVPEVRGDQGEYSICSFEDNKSCEEWALYNRDCPIGGIKTTGFDSPDQIYCAQIGGKTIAEPNAKCYLPNGRTCSNKDLYNGNCQ